VRVVPLGSVVSAKGVGGLVVDADDAASADLGGESLLEGTLEELRGLAGVVLGGGGTEVRSVPEEVIS
jgi:hypothetical protein